MDAGHGRLDRVGDGGLRATGAAGWRGRLGIEAVGLEVGEGEAARGGELAQKGASEGEANGGDCPRCHH